MKKISLVILGFFMTSSAYADWSCEAVCTTYKIEDGTLLNEEVVTSSGKNMSEAYTQLHHQCYEGTNITSYRMVLVPCSPGLACKKN